MASAYRISSLLQGSFAKETYNFKEPTSRSHRVSPLQLVCRGITSEITGLFCRISSLLQVSFAQETYNFKEPTSRSHPVSPLQLASRVQISTYEPLIFLARTIPLRLRGKTIIRLFCRISSLLQVFFCKRDLEHLPQPLFAKEPCNGVCMQMPLVGSLKLQVSFAKETCKRDDILQQRRLISEVMRFQDKEASLSVDVPGGVPSVLLVIPRAETANCRSLLQNIVSFIGLFCQRDLYL